jgi:hypothetical protein
VRSRALASMRADHAASEALTTGGAFGQAAREPKPPIDFVLDNS